jgi:hypothetical protein
MKSLFARLMAALISTCLVSTCLVGCTSMATRGPETDRPRAAHEPFQPFQPEGQLCDVSLAEATSRVSSAAQLASLSLAPQAGAIWLADALDEKQRRELNFSRARVLVSGQLPDSATGRSLRIELVPLRDRDCVAVKLWEQCSGELAPEGAERVAHPCGDPKSRGYGRALNQLTESLSLGGNVEID